MGEAKRRKELGVPPRKNKTKNKNNKINFFNKFLGKYPYLPIILGLFLLAILVFDLINYYK